MEASQAPEVISAPQPQNPYYEAANTPTGNRKDAKKERWIRGLRSSTLTLALLAIIVAAAVGGGVGGSMAVAKAKKASICSTNANSSGAPTTTSGRFFIAPTDAMLPLGCDDGARQSVNIDGQSWEFDIKCNTDRHGADLFGIVSYSLHDCLLACVSYSLKMTSSPCKGVVFASDLKQWVSTQHANCYLKKSSAAAVDQKGLVAAVLSS